MTTSQPASVPESQNLRYPIGKPPFVAATADRAPWIEDIRELPGLFAAAYAGLTDAQLDTPYREGGWTLRQLAHHLADSHMNAFLRMKFALTEDWPTIQPYNERLWAETGEISGGVEAPLALLAALHARMTALLVSLREEQWQRGYVHPERGRSTLVEVAALYAWHGRHHTAHAVNLRIRMGW